MKKIIAYIFLFTSVAVSAQKNNAEDTIPQLAITGAGKPVGKMVEQMMNKDGGTLISGDGKLELIIPAGALSKKTIIRIQSVTNMMPNGNGLGYRLEPSGIQFQQPVQIIFHYNPEESKDSAQLLMGIAMQDEKGQWYGLDEFTLDTIVKTISGNINHFSIWATFDQLKLKTLTGEYRLKVGRTIPVVIEGVFVDKKEMKSLGLSKLKIMKKPPLMVEWYVDGILGGNATVGTMDILFFADNTAATTHNLYRAPDNVPYFNPVQISAGLVWMIDTKDGTFRGSKYLKTKILIYDDAYEVTMISSSEQFLGLRGGQFTYLDTGSFVISLNGKDTKIIEKINKNTIADFGFKGGECTFTTLKPGSGIIHMLDGESINVTPATATQPTLVEIIFNRTRLILPLLKYNCLPVVRGPNTIGTTAAANAIASQYSRTLPVSVRFFAKEGEQILETFGKEGTEIYYKVTVRRISDD